MMATVLDVSCCLLPGMALAWQSRGGSRTPDTRIMIQRVSAEIPDNKAHSENLAAPGAASESHNAPIDAGLQAIIQRWPELPDAVKAGIVAMVRAVGG